jgi:hypothetical protein
MYLSVLNSEEKALFLGLSYNLATSDGVYSTEEKATIAGYCQEMQTTFDEEKMVKPTDEIIHVLSEKSTEKTKKIIVFEAIGLAMADNNYDDGERKIVLDMEKEFGLASGFAAKCEAVLKEYISFQNKINALVLD